MTGKAINSSMGERGEKQNDHGRAIKRMQRKDVTQTSKRTRRGEPSRRGYDYYGFWLIEGGETPLE